MAKITPSMHLLLHSTSDSLCSFHLLLLKPLYSRNTSLVDLDSELHGMIIQVVMEGPYPNLPMQLKSQI